ncbi:putative phosphoglycerate mutase [Candidatus Burkholderia verschuerenii]|uniref:Putative phosphoglycerate mutase n=1 Tax=Candidatus Burkholderia verschuerenii TaxID=242163 RepID=A0A0L0M2A0_9BURK|nr:histidine phosphatase family protein [Candidatus Burkholderia verschuerenii]KND56787.1 putative phosphoglycerate mutase [Candidatus Burkholderia verschuerenii]
MKTGRFPTGDDPLEHDERGALAFDTQASRVIASPARAARDTAQWIASAYEVDAAFDDLDYGRWRGHSIRDIAEAKEAGLAAWITDPHARPHGGESIAMLAERVAHVLERLTQSNRRGIVVTHAIVVKAAVAHVTQRPLESIFSMDIAPLASTVLEYDTVWSVSSPAELRAPL